MFWLQILSLTDWMFCKHMGVSGGGGGADGSSVKEEESD